MKMFPLLFCWLSFSIELCFEKAVKVKSEMFIQQEWQEVQPPVLNNVQVRVYDHLGGGFMHTFHFHLGLSWK